jgi:hypothetical protein
MKVFIVSSPTSDVVVFSTLARAENYVKNIQSMYSIKEVEVDAEFPVKQQQRELTSSEIFFLKETNQI